MGKFKRLTIDEAQSSFPLLNEDARKALKGGCEFHPFFGDGQPHSMDEVGEALNKNFNGGMIINDADTKFWVCDVGWFDIWGYNADLKFFQSQYTICQEHNHCFPFGLDCPYDNAYIFCGTHDYYFEKTDIAECPKCQEENEFHQLYPDGCFEHQFIYADCPEYHYSH